MTDQLNNDDFFKLLEEFKTNKLDDTKFKDIHIKEEDPLISELLKDNGPISTTQISINDVNDVIDSIKQEAKTRKINNIIPDEDIQRKMQKIMQSK
jgi:hypothetical protein